MQLSNLLFESAPIKTTYVKNWGILVYITPEGKLIHIDPRNEILLVFQNKQDSQVTKVTDAEAFNQAMEMVESRGGMVADLLNGKLIGTDSMNGSVVVGIASAQGEEKVTLSNELVNRILVLSKPI